MDLTRREKDKLLIAMTAILPRALITDFAAEGARGGKRGVVLMEAGARVMIRAQVMEGVAEMLPMTQRYFLF